MAVPVNPETEALSDMKTPKAAQVATETAYVGKPSAK